MVWAELGCAGLGWAKHCECSLPLSLLRSLPALHCDLECQESLTSAGPCVHFPEPFPGGMRRQPGYLQSSWHSGAKQQPCRKPTAAPEREKKWSMAGQGVFAVTG